MAKREPHSNQEDVLRLLDTRLACLMVDRRQSRDLRPKLFQLRQKLLDETLDKRTLADIERTVNDILPPGTARAESKLARDGARTQARLRLIRREG